MDIAKDLIDLVNHVSVIPALQPTCSLATEILITVQVNKDESCACMILLHIDA